MVQAVPENCVHASMLTPCKYWTASHGQCGDWMQLRVGDCASLSSGLCLGTVHDWSVCFLYNNNSNIVTPDALQVREMDQKLHVSENASALAKV